MCHKAVQGTLSYDFVAYDEIKDGIEGDRPKVDPVYCQMPWSWKKQDQ